VTAALLELEQAQRRLLAALAPLKRPERVALGQADGRWLAEDLRAALDSPPFPASALDGYAGCQAELDAASEWPVSQRVAAGQWPRPLEPRTLARIFTGAPIPEGADVVIAQEEAKVTPAGVSLARVPARGAGIRPAGGQFRAGDCLLAAGVRLTPAALGLAAAAGIAMLEIAGRPRVALISSGDELCAPGAPPALGQIPDVNTPMLAAVLRRLGAEVLEPLRLPDLREATLKTLDGLAGQGVDLVVSSGGASVGEEDHLRAVLVDGGAPEFWRLNLKPGKPVLFARWQGLAVLGLPGNPVSALVTALLLLAPALRHLQGARRLVPDPLRLPLAHPWPLPGGRVGERREFARARLDEDGRLQVHAGMDSHLLRSVVESDGLVDLPANTALEAGAVADYYPFHELLEV